MLCAPSWQPRDMSHQDWSFPFFHCMAEAENKLSLISTIDDPVSRSSREITMSISRHAHYHPTEHPESSAWLYTRIQLPVKFTSDVGMINRRHESHDLV
jgi:hypothetical protein